MTVHVLHAGDGYTYLTRQVASHDVTRQRGESLTDYYVHDGNPPGRWVGEGLSQLGVTGEVTEAQMKALFGEGRHPNADVMERDLVHSGASVEDALRATQLGRRFPRFRQPEDDGFEARLEHEHEAFAVEHGRPAEPGAERDRLRRAAAGQTLAAAGKAFTPADIARYLATARGQRRQPVAGYDLVFTPVKSVSVLWGLGDERIQREVAEAHQAAWQGALAWLETEAAVTRVGAAGVAQVDTHGLVATAFDHIDSRAGDPNLHTHVAVSNKVLGLDGKWRSLDGRVLHALGVAASERYNTLVETEVSRRLGVEFVEQAGPREKRPVREIAGIPVELREEFSARRASIEQAYQDLVTAYRSEHGHEPSKATQYKMAQQATLTTRQAKEEGVALSTRREQWRARAERVLGSPRAVDRVLRSATHRRELRSEHDAPATFDELHEQVMTQLAQARAVWTIGHIEAEAQRVARTQVGLVDAERIEPLAEQLVTSAVAASLALTPPDLNPAPAALQRVSGESVYRQHATERFTTLSVLDAEDRLVAGARTLGGFVVGADVVAAAVERAAEEKGRRLNDAQVELARRFACGGHVVEAGIGPAGAGKTSAMGVFAAAVREAGGQVLGLAPSAAAAAVLGDELGVRADTIQKLLHAHQMSERAGDEVPEALHLDERTILLVDEAGMASTPDLDALLQLARANGASVRLLGDPAQLQAVGAGGVLRLIDEQVGATHLAAVHRFTTEGEAAASLSLRDGDVAAIDFYIEHQRTFGGTREAMLEEIYASWLADHRADRTSLMIAASRDDVLALSTRARLDRVAAGEVEHGGVTLHDDSTAGVGDLVVTRQNDRRLRVERGTDFVKNGDVWTVVERGDDGALRLRHRDHHGFVTLPADYVDDHVELAYATTIHRAQGMTVDTAHYLAAATASREQLYTGITRGRQSNRVYVAVDELVDPDLHQQPTGAQAVRDCLVSVLSRTDTTPSATSTLNDQHEQAISLATLAPQYEDVWERVVSAAAETRLVDVVRAAVPDLADAVLADAAWPALRALLLRHERAGTDLVPHLREAAQQRELQSATSAAQVLHWRLGEPGGDPNGRLPVWLTPPLARPEAGPQPAAPEPGLEPHDAPPEASSAPEPVEPIGPDVARVLEVNEAAWRLWQGRAEQEDSWVPTYLAERRLAALDAGHAPAGWTTTIDALRAQGFTDDDLTAAGLATTSKRGQLIDRFRDRLVLPVLDEHDRIRAFTARSNPLEDHEGTPKYINSPETAAYRKSERLYGLDAAAIAALQGGATPVLVEGAMDHGAVATLGDGFVPLAPCGTSVTTEQLDVLRAVVPGGLGRLVVATDGDEAGVKAAVRLWTMLDPNEAAEVRAVVLGDGADPADLVKAGRSAELQIALHTAGELTDVVVKRMLEQYNFEWVEHRVSATRDIAAAVATLPAASVIAAATLTREAMGDAAPESIAEIFLNAHAEAMVEQAAARAGTPPSDAPPADPSSHGTATNDSATSTSAPDVDQPVAEWLHKQQQLMAARLDGLVAQVEYAPPAWAAAHIRPVPSDEAEAAAWRRDVRTIVAYRDQWSVATNDVLPPASGRGVQERARSLAAGALTRVATENPRVATSAQGVERARLRVQTEQRIADARRRAEQQTQRQGLAERAAALRDAREAALHDQQDDAAARAQRLREEQAKRARRADDGPRRDAPGGPQV
ncbi:MobF family relaxase [Cellulomonas sp. HD19AZ1]|uniref:MobF family relaxase n=1 Tax=Cellulomonas sp. HD19AZ1 TaxID=2559593 RepID=UPI001070E15C|nr:MobF family relaxase [Cellulomonas sp. HD19AZ1]TFH68150.1 hypothetical protein E4A51_18065 [Cellulomonas sp. HD19AZ1]